jgi:hypothetical protein
MIQKRKNKKWSTRTVLRLPDLDHSKSSVLQSLGSLASKRTYAAAIEDFITWYCSEPRLAFGRTVVLRYRYELEARRLAPATVNLRLAAVRRLAYEASDNGLLNPENGRLVLHVGWADLDLGGSAEDGWSGRLHRKDFDRQVVLTRAEQSLGKMSPFVGTWRRQVEEARFSCLHIVQTSPEAFSGWEDLHAIPGLLRYAPHLKRLSNVIQTYGKAILVSSQGPSALRLESPESLAGCCRYSSLARLNRGLMEVQSFDGGVPRGPWDGRDWRKMPGLSCVSIPRRQ